MLRPSLPNRKNSSASRRNTIRLTCLCRVALAPPGVLSNCNRNAQAGTFLASSASIFQPRTVEDSMTEKTAQRLMSKKYFLIIGSLIIVLSYFVSRIAVERFVAGVEQSRATGLSATSWDLGSMWVESPLLSLLRPSESVDFARTSGSVIRAAQLRECTSRFDDDVASLRRIVAAHRGYFEDLRTQTQSGRGRLLSVSLAVPTTEFDPTLSELKSIGRLVAVSEAGEDANVRLATQGRQLAEAKTNLERLKRLQSDHTAKLLDALALEKEIAQAAGTVSQSEREQESLQSVVARSHIALLLLEDYRAPLNARLDGQWLQLRNASIEGVGAIISSVGLLFALLLQYGLPLAFWLAVFYFPGRAIRQYFRRPTAPAPTPAS